MASEPGACHPARNGHHTGTKLNQKTKPSVLSTRGIQAMLVGEWLSDPDARGAGRLQARKLASGAVVFYYRYTAPDGVRVRMPLGSALTLKQARRVADELSHRYQDGDRDLRGSMQADKREADRARDVATKAAEYEAVRQTATLGALLMGYVAHLRRAGKISARGTESTLVLHVQKPWPVRWATPAGDITTDDLLPVIELVAEGTPTRKGSRMQAGKVRSYFSAAYAAAIRARQDPLGLPELKALRIRSNPARDVATIDGASGARDRALSVAELVAYWKRIATLDDESGALLRFHLLTGGQRIAQLSRVTMADHDEDTSALVMRDPKGRRRTPRLHVVPLLPDAVTAMRGMRAGGLGPFLFTCDAGATGATYDQVKLRLSVVVDAMLAADELVGGRFTPGDLRRTVETRLAALEVSKEHRAHLQSHGLGGVQNRHYDRHEYLKEKRRALVALHRLFTSAPGDMVALREQLESSGEA